MLTGQHHGKTTVTLGMVSMLLDRGLKVPPPTPNPGEAELANQSDYA